MSEPISRFTGKARAYASGRPIYPAETLTQILNVNNLPKSATVYDLGAGTGLFTELLLTHFDHVNLVEPNQDMGATAAQRLPANQTTIHQLPAESFAAPPNSIDLITAAQAFHWFDHAAAKTHWKSMLKPTGIVALIWNTRTTETPFANEITNLLNDMTTRDPKSPPPQEGCDQEVLGFFNHAEITTSTHITPLTERELVNLVLSRSYAPNPSDRDYHSIQQKVRLIFQAHQINNCVQLPYLTKLFVGTI